MPKHTPEEKAAKQKLANNKARIRLLLEKGRVDDATALAHKCGFADVFAARLPPEFKSPTEPFFVALEEKLKAPAPLPPAVEATVLGVGVEVADCDDAPAAATKAEGAVDSIKGWPVETDAKIWGICPNKTLIIIELPDGRTVSMYRGRQRVYEIYDRVRARLVSAEADPVYEEYFPNQ